MLATSSIMIESRADSSNSRRHSFSSFMRHLLFLMSPSSSSNGHHHDAASSSSSSNSSENGQSDKSKNNSLFLEMYFSFPALEDPESETNSINYCAVEQRASSSNFMVGSKTVLC